MKANCPTCGALVPLRYKGGPHPKPLLYSNHGQAAYLFTDKRSDKNGLALSKHSVLRPVFLCTKSGKEFEQ